MREWTFRLRAENAEEFRQQLRALAADAAAAFNGADPGAALAPGADQATQSLRLLAREIAGMREDVDALERSTDATGQSLAAIGGQAAAAGTALTVIGDDAETAADSLDRVSQGTEQAARGLSRFADYSWTVRTVREEFSQLGVEVGETVKSVDEVLEKAAWHQLIRMGAAQAGIAVPSALPLLAFTAAYAALDITVNGAIRSIDRLRATQGDLEKELTRTGYAAGITAGEILDLARAQEAVGSHTQQELAVAMGQLLQYEQLTGATFTGAAGLIEGLAVKTGKDLPTAAHALAAALTDPVKGFADLREAGIRVDAQTLITIQTMMKAGDTAGAVQLALTALGKEIGGAATQMDEGARASHRLDIAWTHFVEAVGSSLQWFRDAKAVLVDLFDLPWEWIKNQAAGVLEGAAEYLDPSLATLEKKLADARARQAAAQAEYEKTDRHDDLEALSTASTEVYNLERKVGALRGQIDAAKAKADQGRARANADQAARELDAVGTEVARQLDALPKDKDGKLKAMNGELDKLVDRLTKLRGQPGVDAGKIDAQLAHIEDLRKARAKQITEEEKGGRSALEVADMQARAQAELAAAYLDSHESGARQEIVTKALTEAAKNEGEAQDALRQKIAERAAAEALLGGAKEIDALRSKVATLREVATAAGVSAAAEAEAERQAKARAVAEELLVKARQSGNQALIALAEEEAQAYTALSKEEAALSRQRQENAAVRSDRRSIETLEAELRLVGATREERAKEIALLKLRQELQDRYADSAEREAQYQARRADTERKALLELQVQDASSAAQDSQRVWTHAAEGIQDALTDSFEAAFDKSKRSGTDFADQLKRYLLSTASQIASAFVFKPMVVGGLNAVGLGDIANSLSPGSGSAGGGGAAASSGAGGSNLFSIGGVANKLSGTWLDRQLGGGITSASSWLNTPLYGGEILNAGQVAQQASQIGTGARELASNSMQLAGSPGAGGVSIGDAIGGVGYGLNAIMNFKDGNVVGGIGNTAATIMSFIPGLQAFAPFVAIGSQLLGGMFGPDRGEPAAAAAVQYSNDKQTYANAATDNEGSAEQAQQLLQSIDAATRQFIAVAGAGKTSGAFGVAVEAKEGKFRVRNGGAGGELGASYDTLDEAVIAAFRDNVTAGLIEVSTEVATALKASTTKDINEFMKDVALAKSIHDATAGLADLDQSLAGIGARAKKAAADQYATVDADLARAKGIGLGDQMKGILEGQIRSTFETAVQAWTPMETAVVTVRAQTDALVEAAKRWGLSITETEIRANEAAKLAKLRTQAVDEYTAALRTAQGREYLTALTGIRDSQDTVRRNLAAAGVADSGRMAAELITAQLRAALSGLTTDQLADAASVLGGQIGDLATSMRTAALAAADAAARETALENARREFATGWQSLLSRAIQEQTAAAQQQLTAAQQARDAWARAGETLDGTLASLMGDSGASGRLEGETLAITRTALMQAADKLLHPAAGATPTAADADALANAVRPYLDAAKAYMSDTDYLAAEREVERILRDTGAVARTQARTAERAVDTAQQQVTWLQSLANTAQGQTGLLTDMKALLARGQDGWAQLQNLVTRMSGYRAYAAPSDVGAAWEGFNTTTRDWLAHQVGYSGSGNDSAFNSYLVANNKGGEFEAWVRAWVGGQQNSYHASPAAYAAWEAMSAGDQQAAARQMGWDGPITADFNAYLVATQRTAGFDQLLTEWGRQRGIRGYAGGGDPPIGEWVQVGEDGVELLRLHRPATVHRNAEARRMMAGSAGDGEGGLLDRLLGALRPAPAEDGGAGVEGLRRVEDQQRDMLRVLRRMDARLGRMEQLA